MERISSIHPSYSTTVGKNMDANSHRWFPEGWAHVRSHWKGKGGYRSKSSSSGPSRKPFAFSRLPLPHGIVVELRQAHVSLPGLPHVIVIELRQAQDCRML